MQVPVVSGGADSTLCLFSVPAGYDPQKTYPLLIALHGGGSNAALFHDAWLPAAQSCGFVLVTPQGELPFKAGTGYTWGAYTDDIVRSCLDAVMLQVHVRQSAIFVAGFSDGGRQAYALAVEHPQVFAGCAALGVGYGLPDSTAAARLSTMRLYIGHGELEPGLEQVRAFAASLPDTNMVRLMVYPGMGHGLPEPVEEELGRVLGFLCDQDFAQE